MLTAFINICAVYRAYAQMFYTTIELEDCFGNQISYYLQFCFSPIHNLFYVHTHLDIECSQHLSPTFIYSLQFELYWSLFIALLNIYPDTTTTTL